VTQQPQGFERIQQVNKTFATYGQNIALNAGYFDGYLSGEIARPEGDLSSWTDDDSQALSIWSELEYDLENLPVIVTDSSEDNKANAQLDEFFGLCHTFHTALPFSEAERVWFLKTYQRVEPPMKSQDHLPRIMGHYEERIVIAGLRQVVSGRELTRRWLAWRGETDEYAGQDTLDVARSALGGLAGLFTVAEPLQADTPTVE